MTGGALKIKRSISFPATREQRCVCRHGRDFKVSKDEWRVGGRDVYTGCCAGCYFPTRRLVFRRPSLSVCPPCPPRALCLNMDGPLFLKHRAATPDPPLRPRLFSLSPSSSPSLSSLRDAVRYQSKSSAQRDKNNHPAPKQWNQLDVSSCQSGPHPRRC